jgi:hypothetical protein
LEGGGAGFDELKKELAGLGEIEKKAGPRGQKKMRKLGSKKKKIPAIHMTLDTQRTAFTTFIHISPDDN